MPYDNTVPPGPDTSNFQKYQTSNPLMQWIIRRFLNRVLNKVEVLQPRRIVDLGCGEGIIASELTRLDLDFDYLGLDLNPQSVEVARRLNADHPNLRFEVADIVTVEPKVGWADLVLCLEVLEHLPHPGRIADNIIRWTSDKALVSVPWEPWFRFGNLVRGRHPRRLGNHPEHIHQFDPKSLHHLLSNFSSQVEVETCFPWIIAVMTKGSIQR